MQAMTTSAAIDERRRDRGRADSGRAVSRDVAGTA
jgi:hypothetical protein